MYEGRGIRGIGMSRAGTLSVFTPTSRGTHNPESNLIRYTQPSAPHDPLEGSILACGFARREDVLTEATRPEYAGDGRKR